MFYRHYFVATLLLISFGITINNANAAGCNVVSTSDLSNIGYSLNWTGGSSYPIYTGYNQLQCLDATGDITQSTSISLATNYLDLTITPPTWLISGPYGANSNPTASIANSSLNSLHILTGVTVSNADVGDTLVVYNSTIGTFINDGTITNPYGGSAIWNVNNSNISSLTNNGTISNVYYNGILNAGTINSLTNNGTINSGLFNGIYNTGTINSLTNLGSISGGGSVVYNPGTSDIFSTGTSIDNTGTLTTLDNAQGKISSPLTYSGGLPTNYNIIINSLSHFGQIAFSNPDGTTTFGISSLSGSNIGVAGTRYENVLSGVDENRITNENTEINYQNGNLSATYKLVADDLSVANTWDLLILSMISGPSATDTQASLQSLAPKLRGAFSSQAIATNFANMNTYDCNLFDAKGLCVSVGGQQTYVDSPGANMTSAVVVAGYKVSPTFRIGGFLNQNVNSNMGSNVDISNKTPLTGLFAVWNQNENHLGYQIKIANAYQDMDVTTTRDVIGTSEAGRGKTDLNTQSYVGELSYAFLTNEDKTLVRPYAALRYTRIKQDGYTEQTSAESTAPLTYAALADRSTTALVGVKLNHILAEKVNLTGSLGLEQDIDHHVDNLSASGVSGLTSENFNDSIKRTRPVASVGAYFMPVKNQRIAADLYYQQLPFQSTGSATAYVNYTIGF